jgi:hypothetical protein
MGLLFCMLHGSNGHKVSNMCIVHGSVLKAYTPKLTKGWLVEGVGSIPKRTFGKFIDIPLVPPGSTNWPTQAYLHPFSLHPVDSRL